MEYVAHAEYLGRLVSKFQFLETAIRQFLRMKTEEGSKRIDLDLSGLAVGSLIPVSAFTSYDSLRELIKKFNNFQRDFGVGCLEEDALVSLRDAIAHGRVIQVGEDALPVYLIKFSREKQGEVRVEFLELLDDAWFIVNEGLLVESVNMVVGAQKA